MKSNQRGRIQVIISAICFGTLPLLTQIGLTGGGNIISILAYRFSIAALLLWGYIWINKIKVNVTAKQVRLFALMAFFGYGLMSFGYFQALKYIPSYMTVMLFFTYPIIVTILSYFLLDSPITKMKLLILVTVSIGIFLISWGQLSFQPMGIVLALLAALFYGVYIIFLGSSHTKHLRPEVLMAFVILFCAIFYIGLGAFTGQLTLAINSTGWISIIVMALFSTVLAMLLFYVGIQNVGPSTAAIISTVEPITAFMLGVVVLGESVDLMKLVGALLILVGVVYIKMPQRRKKIDWKARV